MISSTEPQTRPHDVLVIGAGGAGLRAAIAARETGADVGLVCKSLLGNAALLTGYSLSCHSLRHLMGGKLDCFSCSRRAQVRYSLWQRLTSLNRNHMGWAWISLISVSLADVYVRLLALGVISDPAIRL